VDTLKEKSLRLHRAKKGKFEIRSKVPLRNADDLALAYSPGVAEPCKVIHDTPEAIYTYTTKQNTVAVVTDGSAVLGLGNIGPKAALPVMEGKAVLFKEFAGIDAIPVCLDTQDVDEIVETCQRIAPTFGGINLEDIASPRCVEIEKRLISLLDIPVFHDDQHGTAIVTAAALLNACRLTERRMEDLKIVLAGTGAAGYAIAKLLSSIGIKSLYAFNKEGVVHPSRHSSYDAPLQELIEKRIVAEPPSAAIETLEELMQGTDVFIGVSVGDLIDADAVRGMNKDPIVFAMANPTPEIDPAAARDAGAKIVGTGRSDHPNQINNVLAFPGIFKGALSARTKTIDEDMKIAAARALAYIIPDEELRTDYIIPSPFDKRVVDRIATAVKECAAKHS